MYTFWAQVQPLVGLFVSASAKPGNLQQFLLKKLKRAHPRSCSHRESESVHPWEGIVGSELVDPCVVC